MLAYQREQIINNYKEMNALKDKDLALEIKNSSSNKQIRELSEQYEGNQPFILARISNAFYREDDKKAVFYGKKALEQCDTPQIRSKLECLLGIETVSKKEIKAIYGKFKQLHPRDGKGLDHYLSVLDLSSNNSYDTAHKVWRGAIEVCHTDRNPQSENLAKGINEAWSMIKDVLRK
ncbi:MAG: hypothetical protein KKA79_10750 [Nanoarchaeota archaeon]|nr:hypothetical protein [Nanoarchaeota archaeon]